MLPGPAEGWIAGRGRVDAPESRQVGPRCTVWSRRRKVAPPIGFWVHPGGTIVEKGLRRWHSLALVALLLVACSGVSRRPTPAPVVIGPVIRTTPVPRVADASPTGAATAVPRTAPGATPTPIPTETLAPFTFAAAGDFGSTSTARASIDGVARARPDFFLALGDFDYGNLGEAEWCAFVRSRVGPDLPVELVSGNHEDDTGENGHIENFARCLPDRLSAIGDYGKRYYFDHGGLARFIMITPSLKLDGAKTPYDAGDANLRWLETVIDDARAAGIAWIVVGMHEPCPSIGMYPCLLSDALMDLLIAKRVDLVLQAHDHTYQRSRQLATGPACPHVTPGAYNPGCIAHAGDDGAYTKGDGPVFVVAGSGGAGLYDVHPERPAAGYLARWMGNNAGPTWGFVACRVERGRLAVSFIAATPTPGFGDAFVIAAA
jgi:hypothetical protein